MVFAVSPREWLRIFQAFEQTVRTGFGEFVLDSETRQLLRGGEEIHLSPKAFDLLCTLVAKRPNVVPKGDLFSHIWPDTFVVDGNLNVLVSEIRRAISEDAQSPQFIRTAHGVGYAFCGEATDLGSRGRGHEEPKTRCWLVWKNQTFVLSAGDNVIGRDPGCNVWLDHAGVSRRHARIRIADDMKRAVLDDLESTNGTFVGRKQVTTQTTLADGDVIKLGSVKLTFRSWSDEPSRTKRIRRK
jgi:DNA-binding winged helix-turn-helix (wHTH) protein